METVVSTASYPEKKANARTLVSSMLLPLFVAGFLAFTIWQNIHLRGENQFAYLAQSFLHGDTAFEKVPGEWRDTTLFNGRHYWPEGPLPALVLMPFQLVAAKFGAFFHQGYLQPFFVVGVLLLVYRIARLAGYGIEDAGYLGFGFGFATAFLGVAVWPWSWYFAQVITCMLVFAAIAEMIGRRRPWVLGILFALVLATRVSAALGVFWCIAELLRARGPWRKRLGSLLALGLPIVAVAALLMVYNQARFGAPFDPGYAQALIPKLDAESRALGFFSLHHVPTNLYFMLMQGPGAVLRGPDSLVLTFPYLVANPLGMSIWVTSPLFLYLLGLRYRDDTSRLLLLTSLLIAVPILLFYANGSRQFGYRFSLDFLPYLYYLLLRNYRQQRGELTPGFKAVILGSAVVNLYLFAGSFIFKVVG